MKGVSWMHNVPNFGSVEIDSKMAHLITQMGLNLAHVKRHQKNVVGHLSGQGGRFFKIIDCCRLNNAGIRPLPASSQSGPLVKDMVAFIPAAGASSRYLQRLSSLLEALRRQDVAALRQSAKSLRDEGLLSCPIPQSLKDLFDDLEDPAQALSLSKMRRVLYDLEVPKALYPAVNDGMTFLDIKFKEHETIGMLDGEIYVCPPEWIDVMRKQGSQRYGASARLFYAQDASLATVRFDRTGAVVVDDEGLPSVVPAGHGALVYLLPQVRRDFPQAKGVFIRNIDNVSGCSEDVVATTRQFLQIFQQSVDIVRNMRSVLAAEGFNQAEPLAARLLDIWNVSRTSSERSLAVVFENLFHTDWNHDIQSAIQILNRPFVMMGQVPNTSFDVGGSCAFTQINGQRQKICLERPHASPEDQRDFLSSSSIATHFNPVFVAAEIPHDQVVLSWADHPFWLVAKKSWRGQEVFYQESILYELIGSSEYCNLIFVEVPRLLFNPHKTLFDARNRHSAQWAL